MYHKNKLLGSLGQFVTKNRQKIVFILIIVIAFIPASLLFKQGFPVTDDGTWLVIRFSAFIEALKTGQIPVRFLYRLNDGFGYPVSNFLYPLYLYLATPLYILGFSFLNSIKILIILNIFLSGIFTYLWLNKKFDSFSSLVGSITLLLSPYFLFDIYKRGSVGEILTFSIVPFILWQIERKSFLLLSVGLFLLILAHNTLGFLFLLLIICYVLINKFNLKLFFKSFILSLGLSAFFWIPALYDLSSTVFLKTKVSSFFDYFLRLEDIQIIGFSSIFILIASLSLVLINKKTRKESFFVFSVIVSVVIIFLQIPQSKIVWEIFPFRDFIQFPFRLLSILTILLSYQAAYNLNFVKNGKYLLASLLTILLISQSYLMLSKVQMQNYDDGFYSTNQSSTTVSNEYLSKWFVKPDSNSEKIIIKSGDGRIESEEILPGKILLKVNFNSDGLIQVNSSYFPEWNAKINGIEQEIQFEENGLLNLKVKEGESNISIFYSQSILHKISNCISLASFIILILLALKMLNVHSLSYNLMQKQKNG